MKRTLLLWVALLAVLVAKATPTITTSGDTLVITVNANGDLAARNFTTAQLAATNVKIVTADAVKLTNTDMDQFYGVVNSVYNPIFTKMTDLNLALAEVTNNDVLASLGVASPKMNGGKQLGSLVLPENLTETKFTFNDNKSKWTKVVFPNATKTANKGTTVIGASVFSGNTWIQSVVIGTSVSSVANMAFNGCTNLTEVEYEYGMTHVDSHAFWGCTGLTTVILPESVTEIGSGAFEKCANITTLRLPNSLKYIRSEAFDGTSISSVIIPASVELIERGAFGNVKTLTDVYVLGENTKAAQQAFLPTAQTYGYQYKYYSNGKYTDGHKDGDIVSLEDFNKTGETSTFTYNRVVLHYPEAAYEKYVNKYIQLIGTNQYPNTQPYYEWNNHWVFDNEGNKLPVTPDVFFSTVSGDYAGWNEFMLTAKMKGTYRDERLIDSKWYSVCFPFDLDEKQIGNAFGSATEVCEFSGVPVGTNSDGSKYITLQFKDSVKTMKAHHPYMIHPGLHGATYNMIMDVTIDTDTDNDGFAAKLKSESKSITADGVVYTFIGNHTDGAKVPKYSYYYYSGKDTKWANGFYKAMRTDVVFTPNTAVVKLSRDNGVSGAAGQSFFAKTFRILDGGTTGINGINGTDAVNNANSQNVYNIYGQIVRSGSASVDNLPAGVYIVNGKKYIVK